MNSKSWTLQDAEGTYHVKRWSNGYFNVNPQGTLDVTPKLAGAANPIDLDKVIETLKTQQIEFPVVIRFLDILASQVSILNQTFADIIDEAGYQGKYIGVYPIKVNQTREVVEAIVEAGRPYNHGLEAGSKSELLAVLAYNNNKDALTIINGYKDEEYLRLALFGQKIGHKIVVVIDKFSELEKLLLLVGQLQVEPIIGLRIKMMVQSQGKWKNSSGERSKFGLSIAELLNAVALTKQHNLGHCIELLHFHIGSQITDIKVIKEAVQESSLLYTKLIQMGVKLKYVDVGGGLAIDYDGSQSTSDSSRNYSLAEYVADIVYGFKQTCDLAGVPHPQLVSESGRFITAHHSCVVTQVIGEINPSSTVYATPQAPDEHFLVTNMRGYQQNLKRDGNTQEVFNDIVQLKEQAICGFKLGVLSLDEMAKIDTLYWQVLKDIGSRLSNAKVVPEELQHIPLELSSLYLANFSVFQSVIDSWAINQIIPIIPLSRLNEKPQKRCSLVDITCDSDGKIDQFIGDEVVVKDLPLHQLNEGEDYIIGLFLTGAYQDVMGDMHNLFGRLNEVHVLASDEQSDGFSIAKVVTGSGKHNVLSTMQYRPLTLEKLIEQKLNDEIEDGNLCDSERQPFIDFYQQCLNGYTYLK
ncbi:MAG: arginine decarboxylase [Alteromonadaceae bacterium]